MIKQSERWYADTENRYRGYRISIDADDEPLNPRDEFEPMGKMICFHNRYNLGDEHNYSPDTLMLELAQDVCPDLSDEAEEAEINKIINDKYVILELYLYDHGNLTMSSAPFSCPWDSGQVGVILMTKEQARQEYGNDPDYIARATQYMENEIKTYDAYLSGNVFGWQLYDPEENLIDSCSGYYGYDENIDWIMSEVKAIVDDIYQEREDEAAAKAYEKQQKAARQAVKSAARWK